jgi:ATP-dependent Clp protease protease subunit
MRDLLNQMLAVDTGQDVDRVARDTERDFIMSAEEASEYGLIDEVITTRELAFVPQAAGVA